MEHTDILEQMREIIKIQEKYEHLAEVSYPIWKQRFENDKNNKLHQSIVHGGEKC